MPAMRDLRPVGAEYFGTAPVTDHLVQDLPISIDQAFATLVDADAWPKWIDAITSVEWTSPEPFGVGTTRTVQLKQGAIEEEFFAWEDGRRMAFCFTRTELPMFAAFAEDYRLVPVGHRSCRLTWSWAFEGAGAFGRAHPVLAGAFKRQSAKSLAALADLVRSSASSSAR